MAKVAPVSATVRPDVLGRLLVIPSMLDVLPDAGAMAVFLGAALREVPGVASVTLAVEGVIYPSQRSKGAQDRLATEASPPNASAQRNFPLSSPRRQYGHLLLSLENRAAFQAYEPYIGNIANIVATVLENRAFLKDISEKNRRLQDLLTHLEDRVEERTQELMAEVTRRRQLEQDLRATNEQLELAASVFTHAREGILITDAQGTILDVNKAFTHITGYGREEALGRNPRLLKSGLQEASFYRAMWRDLTEKGYWCGEMWNRRKDGEVYAEMLTISAVCNAEGQTQRYVALFSNITLQKIHQQELEHIAHYDTLTNLPNRTLLSDRLHQAMAQAVRHHKRLAVAYIDLDGFKAINDTHGHEAGDYLLITVASRMAKALRDEDTLARLGGDEFVAVLIDVGTLVACQPILQRLLTAAAQPVQWGSATLQVSASLGATFYPQAEALDADQLLRQADQAMYQAKLSGKNGYRLFNVESARNTRYHHANLDHLQQALAQNQFVLYYQPKVNMGTGQILGAEALIRWQHPDQGLLLPGQFLPALAEHPLSTAVGAWVMATALAQLAQWHATGQSLTVSINLRSEHLQQPNFMAHLQHLLAQYPAPLARYLEIDLLETSTLQDVDHLARIIEACQDMGVQFALDDFGAGCSSLIHLKQLPVAQVKIDQSFVRNMLMDPQDLALIEGVIDLAGAFQRQVVAEGVETLAHGKLLLQLGCNLAQGYSIAHPMPAGELLPWATDWQVATLWRRQRPLNHDDWPLLVAPMEMATWMRAMNAPGQTTGRGHPAAPIRPSPHLEAWMQGAGQRRYGHHPYFQRAQRLYHTLAQVPHHSSASAMSQANLQDIRHRQQQLSGYLKAIEHLSRLDWI